MEQFILTLMEKTGFPAEAVTDILASYRVLSARPEIMESLAALTGKYLTEEPLDTEGELGKIAEAVRQDLRITELLFLLVSAPALLESYRRAGIPEERFWNIILDLRCKAVECFKMYGIWGTFVFPWFRCHYQLKRFGLGRFQYEKSALDIEKPVEIGGVLLQPRQTVYFFHIPSTGESLSRETRYSSYRQAKEFFCPNEDKIVLACHSWLLYPEYTKVYPEKSRLREFYDDFTVLKSTTTEQFGDAWRVFYREYEGSTEGFPAETTLQRNFLRWIEGGNTFGNGYGVIVFDGEKILK